MNEQTQDFDNDMLSQQDTDKLITVGHNKSECEISRSGDSNCPQCLLNDIFLATSKLVYNKSRTLEAFDQIVIFHAFFEMERLARGGDADSKFAINTLKEDFLNIWFEKAA